MIIITKGNRERSERITVQSCCRLHLCFLTGKDPSTVLFFKLNVIFFYDFPIFNFMFESIKSMEKLKMLAKLKTGNKSNGACRTIILLSFTLYLLSSQRAFTIITASFCKARTDTNREDLHQIQEVVGSTLFRDQLGFSVPRSSFREYPMVLEGGTLATQCNLTGKKIIYRS